MVDLIGDGHLVEQHVGSRERHGEEGIKKPGSVAGLVLVEGELYTADRRLVEYLFCINFEVSA